MSFGIVRNYFHRLDFLGDEIKFWNESNTGSRTQSSVGACLSLIAFLLSLAASIYFLQGLYSRSSPSFASQVQKYMENPPPMYDNLLFFEIGWSMDAPEMFLNKSVFDLSFLVHFDPSSDTNYYELKYCDSADFEDYKGMGLDFEGLINGHTWGLTYSKWMCLGAMLNGTEKIAKNDPRYVPVYIQANRATPKLILKRCQNSLDDPTKICLSNDVIDELMVKAQTSAFVRYFMIDYNVDPNIYENPYLPYIRMIGSVGIYNSSVSTSYINFRNLEVVTHDGFVFDKSSSQLGGQLQGETPQFPTRTSSNPTHISLNFQGLTYPQIYQRNYLTLQDVLAQIGGVIKFLFLGAKICEMFLTITIKQKNTIRKVMFKYIRLTKHYKDSIPENLNRSPDPIISSPKDIKIELPQQPIAGSSPLRDIPFPKHKDKDAEKPDLKTLHTLGHEDNEEKKALTPKLKIPEKTQVEKDVFSQETVAKALDLNYFGYLWLKIKNPFAKTPSAVLQVFDSFFHLRTLVFNEETMYRMFFDIQRLKRVILNHEAKMLAFNKLRFDIKEVLEHEKKQMSSKEKINQMQFLNDDISKELWALYQKEIKQRQSIKN